jgi:glycosyltransferase involved in cell wall biosynthesis
MNILHVVIGRPKPEASNGVLKSVYNLAVCQGQLGHKVNVLGIRAKGPDQSVKASKNHEIHLFQRRKARFLLDKNLEAYVHSNSKTIDVVHFHSAYHPEYWCLSKILSRYRIPYFVSPRGGYQKTANKRSFVAKIIYKALFEMPFVKRSERIHALNVQEANDVENYGVPASKIVTIPNGVDINDIRAVRKEVIAGCNEPKRNGFALVYCGRIDAYYKGLDVLMDALRVLVHERNMDYVQLRIIGPDWKGGRETVEELALKYKITDNVLFFGEKYGKDKYSIYSTSDAFILPSRTEGMPTSVLEAMAFGLPCVVTPETNIDRKIMEVGGCVFVDLSAKSIVDAIENLMCNKDLLMEISSKGMEWVKNNYDYKKVVLQHLSQYESNLTPST